MRMRREFLFFSLLSAVWASLASLLGAWLDLSDDVVFVIAIAIVPVLVVAWGRRDDAAARRHLAQRSRRHHPA